jgi:hypothetical protein
MNGTRWKTRQKQVSKTKTDNIEAVENHWK